MRTLINLIFLLLMLLCAPILLYFVYNKSNTWIRLDKLGSSSSSIRNEIQIKNLQIAQLKKENAELKARMQSPLSRPPRPFGQGAYQTGSNNDSNFSRPPRRVGAGHSTQEWLEDLE
jgi:hypothetical protein